MSLPLLSDSSVIVVQTFQPSQIIHSIPCSGEVSGRLSLSSSSSPIRSNTLTAKFDGIDTFNSLV